MRAAVPAATRAFIRSTDACRYLRRRARAFIRRSAALPAEAEAAKPPPVKYIPVKGDQARPHRSLRVAPLELRHSRGGRTGNRLQLLIADRCHARRACRASDVPRDAARGSHPAQQTQVDEAMAGALGEIDGLLTVKRQKEGLYLIGGKARIPAFWQTCGRVCCACGRVRALPAGAHAGKSASACSLGRSVGCIHARRANGRNEENGTKLKNRIYSPMNPDSMTRLYNV